VTDDRSLMRLALDEAPVAADRGDAGFGAAVRFRDLSAAPAVAVRSLGPPTTMSVVSRSVTS
jgi:hypothetical protein